MRSDILPHHAILPAHRVQALEDCFLFNAGKGSVFNKEGKNEMEATIVDGNGMNSGSVACLQSVKNPVKAARRVMEKSVHSLLVGEGAEEFLQGLEESEKPMRAEYFQTDVRRRELTAKLSTGNASKNNHPQKVGAVALDRWCRLAAATSTGGLVGKWKGQVGDTAVVGAGIFADDKLAVTCSGDGDVFLRHTVAQKVASLYHHKGYSLRAACARAVSNLLCERLGVQRCALVFNPHPEQPAHIRVLPLHGLESNWCSRPTGEEDFQPYDPGYCTSKSGPRWEDADLDQVQAKIRNKLP
uniref:Uncharacterized protein n=1 Tax=Oncorhynchus kisutch TaxID=8019 RepID=A0A8C7FA44_ONCKI